MALELKGLLKQLTPTETIQLRNGNSFLKRIVVLDCSYTDDFGEDHNNVIGLEVGGARCAEFDQFIDYVGTRVSVSFGIQGRSYPNSLGETKYVVTLRCVGITPLEAPLVTRAQFAPQAEQPVARPMPQQVVQPIQQAQPVRASQPVQPVTPQQPAQNNEGLPF